MSDINENLRIVNNINYDEDARSLSVVQSMNYSSQPFESSNNSVIGPDSSLFRIISTSGAYVDLKKSFLNLRVKFLVDESGGFVSNPYTSDTWRYFGQNGSVLNLIKEIEFISKDNQVIEHLTNADLQNNIQALLNNNDNDLYKGVGSAMGFCELEEATYHSTTLPIIVGSDITNVEPSLVNANKWRQTEELNDGIYYSIPLEFLCGLAKHDKLMPEYLMSGMTVKIKLNTVNSSIEKSGWEVTSDWIVSNVEMKLAEYRLTDQMTNDLSDIASKDGLKILFNTIYDESSSTSNSSTIDWEVSKNISMVNRVFTVLRRTENVNIPEGSDYLTISENDGDTEEYQYYIGSHPFPLEPVKRYSEMYMHLKNAYPNTAISYGKYRYYSAVHVHDFRRSNDVNLSGLAISNSRRLRYRNRGLVNESLNVNIFVEHSVMLTVYKNNIVVES